MTERDRSPSSRDVLARIRQAASLLAVADAVITGLHETPGITAVAVVGYTRSRRAVLWIGDDSFDPEDVQHYLDGRGDDPTEHRRRELGGTLIDIPIAGSTQVAGSIRAIAVQAPPTSNELALLSAVVSMRLAALGIDLPLTDHLEPVRLSERQQEITLLIARGCTNAEIAAMVGCSTHAIKKQVSRICDLMDVTNRTELAAVGRWTSTTTTLAGSRRRIFRCVA